MIALVTLIGLLAFIGSTFIYVFMSLTNYPLLVSLEFAEDINPWLKPVLIIFGISFSFFGISFFKDTGSQRNKKKKIENIFFPLLFPFTALFIFWFSLSTIPSIIAYTFHKYEKKEYVSFDASIKFLSASSKEPRSNCRYKLFFNEPAIANNPQFVCIDRTEYQILSDGDKVALYGWKSYYAYELKCCKK